MPIVCPACNKSNVTEPGCPRCGCDLSVLHQIAAAAGTRLGAARAALAIRDWPGALAEAGRSWALVHSRESARMAFLAAAAAGDSAQALRWHERAAEG
jgi:hypothetical protein